MARELEVIPSEASVLGSRVAKGSHCLPAGEKAPSVGGGRGAGDEGTGRILHTGLSSTKACAHGGGQNSGVVAAETDEPPTPPAVQCSRYFRRFTSAGQAMSYQGFPSR